MVMTSRGSKHLDANNARILCVLAEGFKVGKGFTLGHHDCWFAGGELYCLSLRVKIVILDE